MAHSGELVLDWEEPEEPPVPPVKGPPQTTTLSTIAVRSGATRIVIALLQIGRKQFELKVLEVEPALTLLGNNLSEASHLLDTHNEVIRQIESKHSPVEELLRRADSVVTTSTTSPERPIPPRVYAAMAESLGAAWRDVTLYLTRRRNILERNVNYHSEAEKCYARMSKLESTCSVSLPPNPESLQHLMLQVQSERRLMLEYLMAALSQGNMLVDSLREAARAAKEDKMRMSALSAISQVEHWLENLHDRRKTLELIWTSRKLKLNTYKTIVDRREELVHLENQVEEISRMIHMEEFNSGHCVSTAQKLYRQNEQYLISAKEVQEKLIKFLKSLEDNADLKGKTYHLLQQCADLIHETESRAELWIKVISFFSSSEIVIEKLKALKQETVYTGEEVKDLTPVLDEISASVVLEGETLGIPIQNAEGIRSILQEIHRLRLIINSAWTRHQDSLIARKLSSPSAAHQNSHEPILGRKYATLPSVMSRSHEYERELRVEQYQRSLTPQHLGGPRSHEFQPIHPPPPSAAASMSRSFDLGYSSFDHTTSNSSGGPLNLNGAAMNLTGAHLNLNGAPLSLSRSQEPLYPSQEMFPRGPPSQLLSKSQSQDLSRTQSTNQSLSRSQEQLKIQEIRRALSPSVEDFESYVRNAYTSPPSPRWEQWDRTQTMGIRNSASTNALSTSENRMMTQGSKNHNGITSPSSQTWHSRTNWSVNSERVERNYSVETEVRKQVIVEHGARVNGDIMNGDGSSLEKETQRRLEMIRENEILRKQEIDKIRSLEKLKQIELRKLDQLKQQRKYEEELLRLKIETEAEEKEKEIEARKQRLKQLEAEKQKEREEKLRNEMEYEREKELERKKEKDRLAELEKLQQEEDIRLREQEKAREMKQREKEELEKERREKERYEEQLKRRLQEEEQKERERKEKAEYEEKKRIEEKERERKHKEDLDKLKELEQELRRKHEAELHKQKEENERLERERQQKEMEVKLERERREKEIEEQRKQEEMRRMKEEEERLEQQRALEKALEKERMKKLKEMEEQIQRRHKEAEEQMEMERKMREKELHEEMERERVRKEREANEKIERERIRKEKELQDKLEEEKRQKEKELEDRLERERIRKEKEAEEELERDKRRKQKEFEYKLEEERRQRIRETEELLELERKNKEKEMQEQLEQDRVRKQRETEERLEQERIRKERELEERLESERMKREVKKEQEMEQKRREKEMEETLEREREAARRREIEADRKHQEELDRIKREQERVDKERRRNEEAIHKQKEEARKQKEQELRKQIEELKEIEREKEKQRLKDLEVIAQLEEERKQQKNDEDRQSQQSPSRNRRQSPTSRTSPTRSSSETSNDTRNTFVSKIPQLKQSPDQQRRTHSPLSHSPDQHRRTQSPLSHSSDQQLRTQSPLSHSSDQRLRTQSPLSNIPEDKLNQHSISEVLSWLTSDVESFVSGHQDMGSGLALAKQFYELHVQFQQDLEDRKTEISSIIASIPSNIKSDLKADLDRKLSILNETYYRLAHTINSRLKLSKHYVSIHELSVNLSIEYDLLDLLLGKRQQQDQLIEDKLDKLGKMKTLFGNVCDRFFKLIEKIGDTDTRLDIERTRSCIDTLLEHFDNRNLTIDTKYHSYQLGISKIQDTKIRLMQNMADSTKTVDWVSKLDAQLYPILSEDLSSSQDVLNHIGDKYRVVLPEIRRALAEIKLRIKTAEDLLGQGQGEGLESLGEGVPPRLKELDEKLSVIVTDYQAMLDVYQTFFQNFLQLEKTISTMSSEVNQSGVSISNVEHMESMLANHEMSKQTAREMFKYVHAESIGVANKIKELEPEAGAEKDISILNRILNSQRKQLDHLYTNQELDLESKKHSIQFDADLNSIQANIDELSQKLNDIRDKSNAAQSAAAAALEFRYLETTIQLLAERIETFVTGADTLKSLEADTSHIDTELHKLKFKWNEFQNQMTHTRDALEHASTGDKGAEFCKQNRQFLSSVTMKSHLISSPQDAQDLVKEIDQYLSTRELKMQEILKNGNSSIKSELTELTEHLTSLRQDLHALTNENKAHRLESANQNEAHQPESANQSEVNEAHQPESTNQSEPNEKANVNEANTPGLSETANQSEEKDSAHSESTNQRLSPQPKVHQIPIRRELDTPVHIEEIESILCPTSPTPLDNGPVVPRVPVFVEPLRNSVVEEGAKFTFKCRVAGFPTPQISWHKDGLSIENNPDYQTSFLNDEASLTIDETFAEDSAKFTCVARNSAGAAETYAFLSITECDPQEDQITAPKFSLKLENVKFKLPTTTSSPASPDVGCQLVRLVCHVTGQPPPTVVWFKEGKEIVEEEGKYRCLLRGGEAVLEIPNAGLDTVGRYECRATNRLGSESSSALVELDSDLPAPKVLVPLPQEAMVRAGQKLKLQCEVENLAPDTKVEWLYNGIPVGDHSRDIKTFIEDSKLTLLVSEAFPKDAGTYSLTLTTPTTSIDSTCKVSVKGLLPNEASDTEVPPEDVEPVKPSIGTPLRDVSLFEGGQALLDCVIVGTPEPEVIWYHDGRPVKEAEDFQLLFKGDKCSLLIKEVFVEDGGEYRVVAINSAGEAESKCKLTVQAIGQLNEPVATRQSKVLPVAATVAPPSREEEYCLPKFSTLITDVLVREGEDALLEAVVEGNPAPRVKWTLNNKDIVYDDRVKSEFNPVDGKTSLFIGKATQQDKGLYTLRAENSLGEVKCFSHVIVKCVNSVDGASNGETQVHLSDIFEVPEFTETFSDAVVPEESPIKFECIAVGKPTPKIKWLFNNEPISGKDFLISTSGARQVLSIPSTSMGLNGGRVSCVAENEAGRTSCSAQLVVTRSLTDSLIPILTPTMSVRLVAVTYTFYAFNLIKTVLRFYLCQSLCKIDHFFSITTSISN
uniref:Muscle M-line assembly protein unc-89 n=2 Tax=Cacopsylla melanoneura TaxID=428564 RepID=A0A8D8ZMR1_9HEMI